MLNKCKIVLCLQTFDSMFLQNRSFKITHEQKNIRKKHKCFCDQLLWKGAGSNPYQDLLLDLTKCLKANLTFWIYPTDTSCTYMTEEVSRVCGLVANARGKVRGKGQRRHNAGLLLIEWAKWLRFWTCCQKNKWKAVFKLKHLVNTLHLYLIALCGLSSY